MGPTPQVSLSDVLMRPVRRAIERVPSINPSKHRPATRRESTADRQKAVPS